LNDCVYHTRNSEQYFCFARGEHMPKCFESSDCRNSIKLEAMRVHNSVKKWVFEKIEEYGNLNYPTVKEKLNFIKSDLENITGYSWEQITNPEELFENVPDSLIPNIVKRQEKLTKLVTNYLLDSDFPSFQKGLENIEQNITEQLPQNFFKQRITQHQVQTAYLSNSLLLIDKNGQNVIDKIEIAIKNNTNSQRTKKQLARRDVDCGAAVAGSTAAGAAGGCVTGAIGVAGVGCGPGALVGAFGGVASGSVTCLIGVIGDACLATTSIVETPEGFKQLSDLELGDYVRTSSGGDYTHFTEFLGWMDRHHSLPTAMLKVSTSNGHSTLTLSKSHVVFTSTETKYADELLPGDSLLQWNGTSMEETYIEKISQSISYGYWAPLTKDGHLLVDGYLTSCYASYPHQLADFAMSPIKAMPKTLLDDETSQHEDGVRTAIRFIKMIGNQIGVRKGKGRSYQASEIQQSFFHSVMMNTEF